MLQSQIVAAARQGIERVGYTETARRSGIHRRTLYRNFGRTPGNGNPKLEILLAVLPAIGLGLCVCLGDPQP